MTRTVGTKRCSQVGVHEVVHAIVLFSSHDSSVEAMHRESHPCTLSYDGVDRRKIPSHFTENLSLVQYSYHPMPPLPLFASQCGGDRFILTRVRLPQKNLLSIHPLFPSRYVHNTNQLNTQD
ncbi:hypothetical protein BHM03_00058639 [Ensete ventricosum]|nr:hypothetical protein BHM03_00058639 [Ensete ventricosum]